jgi:hypothetical protein
MANKMYVRCAFFEGRIKAGNEVEFFRFVDERLLPLWRQFPHVERVEILKEVETETGSHNFPMVLQTLYPSRNAITEALNSLVRAESRALTQELMKMFEGRIFHVIFDEQAWNSNENCAD